MDQEKLVGMKMDTAHEYAKTHGYRLRVTQKDGQGLMVTADYRQDRINVAIEGDTITGVRGIG